VLSIRCCVYANEWVGRFDIRPSGADSLFTRFYILYGSLLTYDIFSSQQSLRQHISAANAGTMVPRARTNDGSWYDELLTDQVKRRATIRSKRH
jgi:hypothetical protein